MEKKLLTFNQLKKALGCESRFGEIDFKLYLYRDFGNGFNVEVVGADSNNKDDPATVYLWYGYDSKALIVKAIQDVARTAEDLSAEIERLKEYSDGLVANGCDNREAVLDVLHPKRKARREKLCSEKS